MDTSFVPRITQLQEQSLLLWKQKGIHKQEQGFFALVEENHAFNYQLWQAEDRARREDKGSDFVRLAKREIDQCNQERNNRMEAMDIWLWQTLTPSEDPCCKVHSETPGMIIDRLSILALKAYHMHWQTCREQLSLEQKANCEKKWHIILQQQKQLSTCLIELFQDVATKKRTFKLYHQFKMYNDPLLNPELQDKNASTVLS